MNQDHRQLDVIYISTSQAISESGTIYLDINSASSCPTDHKHLRMFVQEGVVSQTEDYS